MVENFPSILNTSNAHGFTVTTKDRYNNSVSIGSNITAEITPNNTFTFQIVNNLNGVYTVIIAIQSPAYYFVNISVNGNLKFLSEKVV